MGAVTFPFKVSGEADVINAFNTITRSAERYKKAAEEASAKAAKAAVEAAAKIKKAAEEPSKAATRAAEQSKKAAESAAQAAVKASQRATDKILDDYERQAKAAEKLAARQNKAASKHHDKIASNVGSYAGGMALAAGALVAGIIGSAARESVKLDEMANRISVSARGYGQKGVDPTALRKSFEATAIANPGVKSQDVAAGVGMFVSRTGRLDIAQAMQGTFATAASASGTSMEDIGTAAADLMEKFDIKTIEETQRAFAKLIFQGKEGSFELKDAASQFAKLASAASRFNIGKGEQAVATLGGLTQIAKRAAGSPEVAATSVEHMFSELVEKSPKLKAMGINVFDKNGGARNIQDLLVETISKVGKNDMAKKKVGLQQIFGDQGIRAVSPLITIFEDAFQGAKKTGKTEAEALAAAQAALRAEFEKTINVAASWSEVQKDAATMQKTASAQLDLAWEKVKSEVGEKLTPALIELAPKMKELVPGVILVIRALGALVDWLKTIPAVNKLFEEQNSKEQRKAAYEKQDAELREKITKRIMSNEHQAYDVDQDPILNKMYQEQDELKGKNDPAYGRILNQDQFVEEMMNKARAEFVKIGREKDFDDNKYAYMNRYDEIYEQLHKTADTRDIPMNILGPDQRELVEQQRDKIIYDRDQAAAAAQKELAESAANATKQLEALAEAAALANRERPLSDR